MITHPDKVLFPEDGITKGELAAYYEAAAELMLPHLRGRPVTMERYPSGIGRKGFWQKDVSRGFPDWLERVEVPKKDGAVRHPLANDARSLLWMANQNSITLHVWPSRVPALLQPDLCLFDLDPATDDPATARAATLEVRDLLAELGLRSWVKTTGSKGFHVAVPLDGTSDFEEVASFAHRAGAPVSAPCTWSEVEGGEVAPRSFTLRSMPERLAAVGDLWSDLVTSGQPLREPLYRLRGL